MLKQPRVGDTVILKGIVKSINLSSMKLSFTDCFTEGLYAHGIGFCRISEVIQAPVQVGDTVWYPDAPYDGGTLLFIHQGEGDERKFAVVAYKGDIPKSVPFDQIRLER